MSDEKQEGTPRVGPGSKPGLRYFVTKYPELSITMVAADAEIVGGQVVQKKGKAVRFHKEAKPYALKGKGQLNTDSRDSGEDLGDRNDPPFFGVYTTSDPKIIDFLRGHEYYRMTRQDNQLEPMPWLKELDWDPMTLHAGKSGGGVGVRGGSDLEPTPPVIGTPPAEGQAGRPRARVGVSAK